MGELLYMSHSIEESDENLMLRILNADEAAFALLVQKHTNKFYGLAWRMLSHKEEAEDVVQDAFLKLWQKPTLFNPDKGVKFTTWFYRVVTNMCLDVLRKRKKTVNADYLDNLPGGEDSPERHIRDAQKEDALEKAIEDLPERQKTALNLCFYEGVSNKDAADIMGVGVKALESLLMRAKKSLKDRLIRDGILMDEEDDGRQFSIG